MDEPPRTMLRRLKDPLYDLRESTRLEFYQAPREPFMIRYHQVFVVVMAWILGGVYFPLFYLVNIGGGEAWRGVTMGILAGAGVSVLMISNNDRARNRWINDRD